MQRESTELIEAIKQPVRWMIYASRRFEGGPDAPSLVGWSFNYAHTSWLRSRYVADPQTQPVRKHMSDTRVACSRSFAISALCATPLLNLFQPVDTLTVYVHTIHFFCSPYQFQVAFKAVNCQTSHFWLGRPLRLRDVIMTSRIRIYYKSQVKVELQLDDILQNKAKFVCLALFH